MTQKHYASDYAWKLAAFSLGYEIKEQDIGFRDDNVHSHKLFAYNSFGDIAGEYLIEDMPGYKIESGYLDEDEMQLVPIEP